MALSTCAIQFLLKLYSFFWSYGLETRLSLLLEQLKDGHGARGQLLPGFQWVEGAVVPLFPLHCWKWVKQAGHSGP